MKNKLAFVIEDNLDLADIFHEALLETGFEPEIITTGDEAIRRLAVKTPSAVILDLHLPHVSGPDILKEIRADPRLADTLVIVVTAYQRMAEGLHSQADLVLLKPVGFNQMRDVAQIVARDIEARETRETEG